MKTMSYKRFLTMFSENSYKQDIPSSGAFEMTPLCNLDCKMCYVHLQDPSVKERMLSGKQWISIMKCAIDRGMINALLTGGEAMTHPDFWEIYMYLIDNGVSPRIKTNGLLLTKDAIDRFVEFPPYVIDVSLYGCNSESYIAVTGVDAFDKVTNNIRAAIDAGLKLRIMITPSSYMSEWTVKTMELAKTFGVQIMVNSMLIEPNDNTGRKKEDFDLTESENDMIRNKMKELFPPKHMSKEEEDEISGKVEKRPDVMEKGLHCNGGRTYFAMNWDGTMKPCINFPREIICAKPLQDGFDVAWKEVNEGVKNYKVPEKCHSCAYNTKCHYCPVQHSRVAAQHLCDPEVCSFWMHLYKDNIGKEE